jgi:hypothetical protein
MTTVKVEGMSTIGLVVVAVVVSVGAGFGAGWRLRGDGSAKALEAQAASLQVVVDGQATLAEQQVAMTEALGRPVVIDAELRAQLAEVPVQCIRSMGGDPQSSDCFAATCWQFGQTGAQRPECSEVVRVHLDLLKKRDGCVD